MNDYRALYYLAKRKCLMCMPKALFLNEICKAYALCANIYYMTANEHGNVK